MPNISRSTIALLFLIVGIGAGFLIASAGLSGCGSPKEPSVPTPSAIETPKFWSDDVGAAALKSLGYDQAYLFRWRNGAIDGWVEFDGIDGPKRIPLDDTLRAAGPDEKPGRLETRRISGFVVVALKKQPDDGQVYEVRVEQEFTYDMGVAWDGPGSRQTAGYRGASHSGKVKYSSGESQPWTAVVVSSSSAKLMKRIGGKSTPWLELRFVSSAD